MTPQEAEDILKEAAGYKPEDELIDSDDITVGEALYAIQLAAERGNEWISVEDRLPEKGGEYLVVNDGAVMVAYYYWLDKDWHRERRIGNYLVTHWIPLPKPPNNE